MKEKKKKNSLLEDREIQLILPATVKLIARKEFHIKFEKKTHEKSHTHFLNKIRVRNMGIRSEMNAPG